MNHGDKITIASHKNKEYCMKRLVDGVEIPAQYAADMPYSTMVELKKMVQSVANGEFIVWRGFSDSPRYWCLSYEVGNNPSTKMQIVNKTEVQTARYLAERKLKNFGV